MVGVFAEIQCLHINSELFPWFSGTPAFHLPPVKGPTGSRKKSSKHCFHCGKKTGLATSYECRLRLLQAFSPALTLAHTLADSQSVFPCLTFLSFKHPFCVESALFLVCLLLLSSSSLKWLHVCVHQLFCHKLLVLQSFFSFLQHRCGLLSSLRPCPGLAHAI